MITEYVSMTQRMFSGFDWISNIDPRKTRNKMIMILDVSVRKTYFLTLMFVKDIA